MKKESDAILMRVFIGESDKYEGKSLSQYLVEFFKQEGLAEATIFRGIGGFGKKSKLHTASILVRRGWWFLLNILEIIRVADISSAFVGINAIRV